MAASIAVLRAALRPLRLAMRDVAGAVLLRELLRFWVGGVVFDDDELGAVLGCLRRRGGERDREVVAPPARRDQDRGGRGHRAGA